MRLTTFTADGLQDHAQADLEDLLQSERLIWVDMTGPTAEDLRVMREVFQFHPMSIQQTHNEKQRPKVETYGSYAFLILNPVTPGASRLTFRELNLFVGDNYVVTVHAGPEPTIATARQRIIQRNDTDTLTTGFLMYVLMDVTIDGYFPVLDGVGAAVEGIEQMILTNPGSDITTDLLGLKRVLTDLWRVLWPQRDVSNTLLHHEMPIINNETVKHYLRDVADHLLWLTDMTDHFREILTGITGLHMSAVSIRLNRTVSRLSVIAVVVGALTVISAFYGMNFNKTWPPYGADWSIYIVMGLMLIISGLLVTILSKMD